MKITRKNPISGKINTLDINVTQEQLDAHYSGTLIQDAMPNVPPEHRDFILLGMTPEEIDALFEDDEE